MGLRAMVALLPYYLDRFKNGTNEMRCHRGWEMRDR
jgi:hypothetical protein